MTIIGFGEPTWMRAPFTADEMDLVTEELRALRAVAVGEANATHEQHPGDDRDDIRVIDAAHDRLREIDDAMRYIEDKATSDSSGRIDLVATTSVMTDLVRGVADRALTRLEALRKLYMSDRPGGPRPDEGRHLLKAAQLATQAATTFVACLDIDYGPDDPPYLGMRSR